MNPIIEQALAGVTATMRAQDFEDFFSAYIACALWSTTNEEVYQDGSGPDESLSVKYDEGNLASVSYQDARDDCHRFMEDNKNALREATCKVGYSYAAAGHDFWLTRNGHGAGFWDRGLGEVGERLSEAARKEGEVYLYIGDDGKLYF